MISPPHRRKWLAAGFHAFVTVALVFAAAAMYGWGWNIPATIALLGGSYLAFAVVGILLLKDNELPVGRQPIRFLQHTNSEFQLIGTLAGAAGACLLLTFLVGGSLGGLFGAAMVVFAFAAVAASTMYEDD